MNTPSWQTPAPVPPSGPRAVRQFIARAILVAGFLVPMVAISLVWWNPLAEAATTYCGRRSATVTQGGTSASTYIDAYGDPGCFGSRYVAYDHYNTSTVAMDSVLYNFKRVWQCGSLTINIGANTVYGPIYENTWIGWSTWNSCGFQSDQQTHFVDSGPTYDQWMYVNW